ncbi:hypothetical protein [Mycolicibacterium phocaicum]|uniref:Uncharacterized protein n=1 Tax=Mycolicibacterium phocaicum TaxID=319706 RepID=A0A7I7ZNA9_9MYCO|nr:hypothetical protein [Mycolicibacterium phocaicum]TLH73673.1 hypothetical protein C1S79_04620 [Mycolicibacterium phocaicum]BBZ55705.1 hypothetical protein MPHO_26970 [Mycolicibacterium phocaicum]
MTASGRTPLPYGATTWNHNGRKFVQVPGDMYVYEYDENGALARVLVEDLPTPTGPNFALERLAQEVRDANPG